MYEKQAEWEKKFAFTYSSPHVCLVCKEEQPVLSQYGCLALVSLHIFLVIITIVTDVATSSFTPTRARGLVLCTMMHRGAGQLGLGVKRCIVSMDRCPILPHQFCLRLFFSLPQPTRILLQALPSHCPAIHGRPASAVQSQPLVSRHGMPLPLTCSA